MANKADKAKLAWTPVDTDGFKGPLAAKYKAVKDAQAASRAASEAFEAPFIAALIAGGYVEKSDNVVISFRFGQLSFAIAEPKAAKKAKGAISL